MKVKRVDHVGIAVADLASAKRFYEGVLGLKLTHEETVSDQGVRTHFYKIGDTKMELLESLDPSGAIARFIEKRGAGVQHLAIEVEDIDAALAELKAKGVKLLDETARRGVENTRIAFLHPSAAHGVLVELVEFP
ncbi:MAG: methylmalonyl-CoA epimerase [Thermoplasmatota archaeon]